MRKFQTLIVTTTLFLAFASPASAARIDLDFASGIFAPRYYEDGNHAGDYNYVSVFDLSGLSLTLDNTLNSAQLIGNFAGELRDRNGARIGSSTGTLDIMFQDLSFQPTLGDPNLPIIALGEEGKSTSTGSYSFALNFDNRPPEAETIDVFGGFASPGANHPIFSDLAGIAFNFLLRENGQFDVWIKSLPGTPFTLFNDDFHLHGDIHGTAEVPEPGSLLLLGAALAGSAMRRRKL